jgi:hypothetical protein
MLTRIDHVMICVPDLEQGMAAYRRMGFTVEPGGVHPGRGTHNAIAFHREDYIEVLGVHDREELRRAASAPGSLDTGLLDLIERGGGFRYIIVHSDDLPADVAAMRGRGVDVGDAVGARRAPARGIRIASCARSARTSRCPTSRPRRTRTRASSAWRCRRFSAGT